MSLRTPPTVQKLQTALHAKAKGEPRYRFYALYDKVYREDVLAHAYARCRGNRGAPGVDGETFATIESAGRQRWLADVVRTVSTLTARSTLWRDTRDLVDDLNRLVRGWANDFSLGTVRRAYRAVDAQVTTRLRRWLCCKHKQTARGTARYRDDHLYATYGLVRLPVLKRRFPWANA